jgi:predicted Zn-dependent protease
MSAGQLQQVIGAGVSVATSGQSEKHNKYGIKLMVLVHKWVMLPFSRNHETEADQIGLTLMAIAGYNRRNNCWTRMANSNGEAPPEFLSTQIRCIEIASLKAMIPQLKLLL